MSVSYATFAEQVLGECPVFVIGSGVSLGAGVSGMWDLALWLMKNVAPVSAVDVDEWEVIKHRLLVLNKGLEESILLSGDKISPDLLRQILLSTWELVSEDEQIPFSEIASGNDIIGFRAIFEKYQFTNNAVIHVITPNYDHLIEWSAAAAGWAVWDGFGQGPMSAPVSSEKWSAQMQRIETRGNSLTRKPIQHLCVHKPHGSLSWFETQEGVTLSLPGITRTSLGNVTSKGFMPAIVTPGQSKYLKTHYEPFFSAFSEMNKAIQNAKALVFAGYGFNDAHFQAKFSSKFRDRSIPKIILSKKLTGVFHTETVGSMQNYMAVEEHADGGSRIYSDKVLSGIEDEGSYWTLKGLTNAAWRTEN